MKIRNKDLKKAWNLVKRKKYPQAIRFLEPKVPLFLEDELFYYLLGISCFHTGDVGGSEFYFKRSLQVNSENLDARLFLAAVQLKKKEQAGAARIWLNILDMDSGNKFAKKGLDKLKKIKNPSELEQFINSSEVNRLMPSLKGFPPLLKSGIPVVLAAIIIGMSLYYIVPGFLPEKSERESMGNLSLENYIGPYIELEGDYIYELSGDEIRQLFESAVSDFHNYDDNSLQMKINKLKLSNASEELISKISLVEGLIQQPTFLTMKTKFDYREIVRDPLLYKNCYVLWSGKVTNVNVASEKITFDFLVGYEEETVLDGIVFVEVPFEANINESVPLELLGQVRYRNGKILITAVSIRPII